MNSNLQAVVVRYGMPFRSKHQLEVLKHCLHGLDEARLDPLSVGVFRPGEPADSGAP
jgi:hypothetical protein